MFSPSRVSSSFYCKSAVLSSPEKALTLNISPSSSSLSSSLSSPLRLRTQKPPSGLNSASNGGGVSTSSSSPPVLLKRKRPVRFDILILSTDFGVGGPAMLAMDQRDMMEVDRDGYSVYCKKERREAMEDRYSTIKNLQGDPK